MIEFQALEEELKALRAQSGLPMIDIAFTGKPYKKEKFSISEFLLGVVTVLIFFALALFAFVAALLKAGWLSEIVQAIVACYPTFWVTAAAAFLYLVLPRKKCWKYLIRVYPDGVQYYMQLRNCGDRAKKREYDYNWIDFSRMESFYNTMWEEDRPLFLQALKDWKPGPDKDYIADVVETLRWRRGEMAALKDLDTELKARTF